MNINIINLAAFEQRLASLNRRARRLRVPEITFTKVRSFPQDVRVTYITEEGSRPGGVQNVLVHEIEVRGGAAPVKLNGWAFRARLTPMEGGNQIAAVGEGADLPAFYRTCPLACDHCRTNRRRNDTFVLQHTGGALQQVGRNCLVDFLGDASGDALAAQFAFMAEVDVLLRGYEQAEGESYGGGGEETFSLENVIAGALAVHGGKFISKKAAKEDCTGRTMSTAMALLLAWSEKPCQLAVTETQRDLADEIIADTLTGMATETSDYAHNCLLIARAGYCTRRSLGIAVSLLGAWNRRKAQAAQQAAEAVSEFQGAVGERLEWVATMVRFFDVSGGYGLTRKCVMRTEDGAVLMVNNLDCEPGETVTFKATVKAHNEYRGAKQTILSRPAGVKKMEVAVA